MKLEPFSRHSTRLGICLESSLKINSRKLSNLPRTCTMLREEMMVTIDLFFRHACLSMLYCSAKNIEFSFLFCCFSSTSTFWFLSWKKKAKNGRKVFYPKNWENVWIKNIDNHKQSRIAKMSLFLMRNIRWYSQHYKGIYWFPREKDLKSKVKFFKI